MANSVAVSFGEVWMSVEMGVVARHKDPEQISKCPVHFWVLLLRLLWGWMLLLMNLCLWNEWVFIWAWRTKELINMSPPYEMTVGFLCGRQRTWFCNNCRRCPLNHEHSFQQEPNPQLGMTGASHLSIVPFELSVECEQCLSGCR